MAEKLAGVVLAGGRSSRLGGGDKPLLELGGETMLACIVRRLRPQVDTMAINANGDAGRFSSLGLPVISDATDSFDGPLAGILAAMQWAGEQDADAVLTVAGDTPFFPDDLAIRLLSARPDTDHIAVATSAGRRHPTFALWPIGLAADLRHFLDDPAKRKVTAFIARHRVVSVAFDAQTIGVNTVDPFFNINTPEDLAQARRVLQRQGV